MIKEGKMTFSLEDVEYFKIKSLFKNYPNLITQDFENHMKQSIKVLHFKYLWGACRETENLLKKYPCDNLYKLIMKIYSKKRKKHQINFLLLHCFENALRSTLAVKIANLYNITDDDWFFNQNINSKAGFKTLLKILRERKKHLTNEPKNTFEIFDCFYLIDLEDIISSHWSELSYLFKNPKTYKNQDLPSYGTKEYLLTKISQIRKARNEIFHNKPTKIKFQKDLEILLLRMGYNLEEAVQIGEISTDIKLHYTHKA